MFELTKTTCIVAIILIIVIVVVVYVLINKQGSSKKRSIDIRALDFVHDQLAARISERAQPTVWPAPGRLRRYVLNTDFTTDGTIS